MNLPDPECRYGYPKDQLDALLGARVGEFNEYMAGQTVAMCEGREYDHEAKEWKPNGCGPHGVVCYRVDVGTFLAGRPTLD